MFWDDLTYLNRGSEHQREAFRVLIDLDIFSRSAEFDPILTGTFPLAIETPQSDLDILCCAADLDRFEALVGAAYDDQDEYELRRKEMNGLPTTICNFRVRTIPIELFAQARPVEEQNGYLHLIAEARRLREGGDEALIAIRILQQEGIKTEPAFGQYFCLPGDPYETLLTLAEVSAEELRDVVLQARIERRNQPMRLSAPLQA